MFRFLLGRLAVLIPTFIGVTIIAFAFIRLLPGDPIMLLSGERVMDQARYEALTKQFGYDRPYIVQYFDYLWGVLHGDFGTSISTKDSVLSQFLELFPATLELSLTAMVFAVLLGLPAGVIAAVRRGSVFDHAVMSTALVGYSMPIFWWGLLLIIVFSGWLGWTPVSGRISLLYFFPTPTGFMLIDSLLSGQKGAFQSAVSHLILPAIVLGTIPLAVIARQTRSAMLEVLGEDYVRTARAKGLSEHRILGWHVLRNAAIPIITYVMANLPGLLIGAFLIERFFSIPGIGREIIMAVDRSDFPVIKAITVYVALATMIFNLLADLMYRWVDPRVQLK